MSTLSGLGNKGESKNKGKYTAININNLYKGTSIAPQKSNVSTGRHGLQSLGKVGSARRMPPPAHLPSLKSENSGNDPTVNLVPSGGAGWGSSKEEKGDGGTPPTSSQQQQGTSQSQGQTYYKRPTAGAPQTSQSSSSSGATAAAAPGIGPSPQQQQPPTHPTQQQIQAQPGATAVTPGGNQQAVTQQQQVTKRGSSERNGGGGGGAPQGIKSWSGIAGGIKKHGGIVDQSSPFFQEEFPTLAIGGEEKSDEQQTKKEDANKESQYGPGPSLRPQNVGSWKEGGGRPQLQPPPPSQETGSLSQQHGSPSSSSPGTPQSGTEANTGPQLMPPQGGHPGGPGPVPTSPVAGGQPGGARPPHMGPGGPMMPPFRPGMMPPHFMYRMPYPNFQGMRPPPGPYPYPHDQRFRGPPPRGPPPQRQVSDEEVYQRPSIVKQEDLNEFEKKVENTEGGWAASTGEVDYSEKLVFSDEEDDATSGTSGKEKSRSEEKKRTISERSQGSDKGRDDDGRTHDGGGRPGPPFPPREGWMPPPQGQFRGPPGPDWQRMPFGGRPPMPGFHPDRFRMPPGGQRFPFHAMSGERGGPMPPPPPQSSDNRVGRPDDRASRSGDGGSRGSAAGRSEGGERMRFDARGDEEDELRWQRRKKKEEVSEAMERAKLRREEEERKSFTGKDKARENLKVVEERLAERRKAEASKKEKEELQHASETSDVGGSGRDRSDSQQTHSKTSGSEDERPRASSEGSDQERFSRDGTKGGKMVQKIPPRMQQQQQQPSGPKTADHPPQGPHPGMRGPPHWPYDPRGWSSISNWPGMPMHPQMRRRRNESGGSDGERRTPDMPPFDPRMWGPYGPPPPGWDENMRRGPGPSHPHYYGYPPEFDREMHSGRSEMDDFSGWGADQQDNKDSERPLATKEGVDKPFDAYGRKVEEPWEAEEVPRQKSPKEDKGAERVSKVQKDPFSESFSEDKKERQRRRSWGEWVDEEGSTEDQEYGKWKDGAESRNSREPTPTTKVSRNEKEEIVPEKQEEEPEEVQEERSSKRERDYRGRGDRVKSSDQYEGGENRKSEQRSGRGADTSWNPSYQSLSRGNRGKGGSSAPVPIPSQVVRENLPAAKSNFTSLKRTHGNVNTSSTPSSDRKMEQHTQKETGNSVEKPERAPVKAWSKTDSVNTAKTGNAEDHEKPPQKAWSVPKNEEVSDVSSKIGVGEETKPIDTETPAFKKEVTPIKEQKEDLPHSERGSRRESKEGRFGPRDKKEDDKPPTKRPRDDAKDSRYRGGRKSDEFDRGSEKTRGRGRSGGVREYVRGGGGRGRSRPGYSSNRGRGRGGGNRDAAPGTLSVGKFESPENTTPATLTSPRGKSGGVGGAPSKSVWGDPNPAKPRDSTQKPQTSRSQSKEPEGELQTFEGWNDPRRRTRGDDSDDLVSLEDNNSPSISETSSDKNESRENSIPKQPQPLTSRWSDVARDRNSTPPAQTRQTPTVAPPTTQQQVVSVQQPPPDNKPPALMSLNVPKPPSLSDTQMQERVQENRRDYGGRGRGRDRRERRYDDSKKSEERREGFGRSTSTDLNNPSDAGRGKNRGKGPMNWDENRGEGPEERHSDNYRRGGGSRGRGGRNNSMPSGGFGKGRLNYDEPDAEEGGDRRKDRRDRHSQPPRFNRGGSGSRGSRSYGERGSGRKSGERGRGRGASTPSRGGAGRGKSSPQQQPLNNQLPSPDLANEGEEWETASESSDVLTKGDLKDVSKSENSKKDATKKSFSGQRPNNDRQNRRGNSSDNRRSNDGGNRANGRDSNNRKERSPNATKIGPQGGSNGLPNGRTGRTPPASRKENVGVVYRVDRVEHEDPNAIQNAINTAAKKQSMKKNSELSDVSKPLKPEKEKKDALANIDINNFASVVVIDDQPEVTFDDPSFLFENNEGFQEVCSKKTQKNKRAQDTSPPKIEAFQIGQTTAKTKKSKEPKVVSKKLRGVSTAEQKRLSKLPPRLAKMKAEELKERKQQQKLTGTLDAPVNQQAQQQASAQYAQQPSQQPQSQSFVIEDWDSDLANTVPVTVGNSTGISTNSNGYSVGVSAPAPAPSVNAWDKPISFAVSAPTVATIPQESSKFDKGDQHDSGIDVSEPLNSAGSSTRSSPSGEKKIRSEDGTVAKPARNEKPKPDQKLTEKSESLALPKKPLLDSGKGSAAMSKGSVEPIQLPPSFKDAFKYKGLESSELKLEFTFDEELAKLTEEKMENKDIGEAPAPIPLPTQAGSSASDVIDSPTENAAVEMNMKFASLKKVWDSVPTVYEKGNSATVSIGDQSQVIAVSQSTQQSTFPGLMDSQEGGGASPEPSAQQPQVMLSHSTGAIMLSQPSSTPTMLSQSVAMLSQSASAVEVSVSFPKSSPHHELSGFSSAATVATATAGIEYAVNSNVSDYNPDVVPEFSNQTTMEFLTKSEFAKADNGGFSGSVPASVSDFGRGDLSGFSSGTVEYTDPKGEFLGTSVNMSEFSAVPQQPSVELDIPLTSQGHHIEAGLMSATDMAGGVPGPVMTQMTAVGIPETISSSSGGVMANRSVGSRTTSEQSNVCKVKPQQQQPTLSLQQLSASQSPSNPLLGVGGSGLTGPSGIHSPPTPQMIMAPQASQYHSFQMGGSSTHFTAEPSGRNLPNLFGLSHTAMAAPHLPQQQPSYNTQQQQPQGQSLIIQTPDPYGQSSQLTSSFRNQLLGQSQGSAGTVSTNSSMSTAGMKPAGSQPTYLTNSQPSQQTGQPTGQKTNPLAALQYSQLSSTSLPHSLFVQYEPGQPIGTASHPQQQNNAPNAVGGGGQTAGSTTGHVGSQLLSHRVQSVPGNMQNSYGSQQSQTTPLQQTGFYQAQQTAYNIGPIQQVSAGTPTALAIQGFSPHSLGLQLAAPPPQQQQQQIPTQQQQQTISLSGSQSQLNKSAPPFKPASQKQQQQTVTAPTQQPQQQPGGPLPQQTSSQPNTPTQLGGSQSALPGSLFPNGNLTASLPNVNIPPPNLVNPPKPPQDQPTKALSSSLGPIKDAGFQIPQTQGRMSLPPQPSHQGNQQLHRSSSQKQLSSQTAAQQQSTQPKYKQQPQHFMGSQQQQQQLQQNMFNSNLMQAQIQLIQSLQRSSLPANSMNSITNRFGAQTGAHNPLAALQQQAGNSGSNKVQQPAQAPTIQQPVQQPQQVSRETAALPSRGSVGGGSRSQGHGLSNKDSFKEEQAKQRQEIIQATKNFMNASLENKAVSGKQAGADKTVVRDEASTEIVEKEEEVDNKQ